MKKTVQLSCRLRTNLRIRVLVVVCILVPIFVAAILALIGPQIGSHLPPGFAYSVNIAVIQSFKITAIGIVVLIFLVAGFAAVFRLFMVGIFTLTVMAVSMPSPGDSIYLFIGELANRSIGEPIAHYAITEGLVSSSPHRTAIEIECVRERLTERADIVFHDYAGLLPPKAYMGKYVQSVSATTVDETRGRIVVLLAGSRDQSAWPLDIAWTNPGDMLVWEGACTSEGADWVFSASLPTSYQPKGNSSRWWLPPRNL